MNQQEKQSVKKSRRQLLMLLAVFIIPVIVAKIALSNAWLSEAVTNKGELVDNIEQVITFSNDKTDEKWLLLVKVDQQCGDYCASYMQTIENTYTALGKEMPRTVPVALVGDQDTGAFTATPKWYMATKQADKTALFQSDYVYVVDPLGRVIMRHHIPTNSEALPAMGKAILADMKKLLKYSRIG
ncbi:hypothetical protein [Thalassotalea agarivorans]|uniref:Cytochrome oxidase Cu insertion factor, SCO1/SenC/PrrC family n=1 Tax=Thalassotalea agarivorans TaxID=349064 RepID=A0A1I0HQQ6_THASX|nr:hypothetical protein [Thalassotalea agarivorans]SET85615.1 hypothetical protein SAMN05660429_02872 [Thalassotalea agarivorans]